MNRNGNGLPEQRKELRVRMIDRTDHQGIRLFLYGMRSETQANRHAQHVVV